MGLPFLSRLFSRYVRSAVYKDIAAIRFCDPLSKRRWESRAVRSDSSLSSLWHQIVRRIFLAIMQGENHEK
jgi:hypothetical protein